MAGAPSFILTTFSLRSRDTAVLGVIWLNSHEIWPGIWPWGSCIFCMTKRAWKTSVGCSRSIWSFFDFNRF